MSPSGVGAAMAPAITLYLSRVRSRIRTTRSLAGEKSSIHCSARMIQTESRMVMCRSFWCPLLRARSKRGYRNVCILKDAVHRSV